MPKEYHICITVPASELRPGSVKTLKMGSRDIKIGTLKTGSIVNHAVYYSAKDWTKEQACEDCKKIGGKFKRDNTRK